MLLLNLIYLHLKFVFSFVFVGKRTVAEINAINDINEYNCTVFIGFLELDTF